MKEKSNPTVEQKLEFLLQAQISTTIFSSLMGLAALILIAFLYPAPLNGIIAITAVVLAMTIYSTIKKYTKM